MSTWPDALSLHLAGSRGPPTSQEWQLPLEKPDSASEDRLPLEGGWRLQPPLSAHPQPPPSPALAGTPRVAPTEGSPSGWQAQRGLLPASALLPPGLTGPPRPTPDVGGRCPLRHLGSRRKICIPFLLLQGPKLVFFVRRRTHRIGCRDEPAPSTEVLTHCVRECLIRNGPEPQCRWLCGMNPAFLSPPPLPHPP